MIIAKVRVIVKVLKFILCDHWVKKKIFLEILLSTKNNNKGIEAVTV